MADSHSIRPSDLQLEAAAARDIQQHVAQLIDDYGLDVIFAACVAKVIEREAAFQAVKDFIRSAR